ncbi:TRAP transporter small permease [uncultured Thioclava sp.]|uniref:TRAP transporter small permease n=1 Tax=uncultured Thioclava sp. TaxID=473858 RepID=UPI0025EE371F|nr:TRAP transporter small permease [uncultured Thioclava sp.]
MNRITAAIRWLSDWIAKVTSGICVLLIFVMLGLLSLQVAMRYLLGAPPSWTEEMAIILFCWVVLLYGSVGLREGSQVAVDLLPERFERIRAVSDRIVQVLVLTFGGILFWSGWFYVLRTQGQRTAALQAPIDILYLSAPVAGALIALHAIAALVSPLARDDTAHGTGADPWEEPSDPSPPSGSEARN